jgi:hypothetical protein
LSYIGENLTIFGFNDESLTRHGVTQQECLQALADPLAIDIEEPDSADENTRIMWVGKTHTERTLEVGVEYLDGMDWIYHANDAQNDYKQEYEARRR